jgi:SAM-dependent methyltransferase
MREADEHRAARLAWDRKPALRVVYGDLLRRIGAALGPGRVLEVGGGASRLKTICPQAIISDLMSAPGLDLVADAQQLPFPDSSLGNIVLFDVLHHVPRPAAFLAEASRVLKPGGRLVMMEPAITPGSHLFYRFLHPERLDMRVDPLAAQSLSSAEPYDANQAIPTLLCTRHRAACEAAVKGLSFTAVEWLSVIAYPLSGGLRPWSLLGGGAARALLALEDRLPRAIRRALAFRVLIVMTRTAEAVSPVSVRAAAAPARVDAHGSLACA